VRFAGYAALFDRPDRGGDVIRKGAFAKALESAGEVPLLWQHKAGAVVGRIEHLSEDERGLRVIAALGDARLAGLLGSGKVDGLSFGYRVREAKSAGGLRELVELDLVEVSLVANPMQPRARVHAVEQAASLSEARR
jgi:HK97 family phage prohead protease